MGEIWFTSDTHFNHINILKFEPEKRPFVDFPSMNEVLIKNWNSVVGEEDDVYHLGDMFMGRDTDMVPILERLKGRKHLIIGNHDTPKRINIIKPFLASEPQYLRLLQYKGYDIVMCHFPVGNENFAKMIINNGSNANLLFLYGHVHSNSLQFNLPANFIHVGVDTNGLTPINLKNLIMNLK